MTHASETAVTDEYSVTGHRLASPESNLALAWVVFQVVIWYWPEIDLFIERSGHIGFASALAILIAGRKTAAASRQRVFDYALAGLALLPPVYYALNVVRLNMRISLLDPVYPMDYAMAAIIAVTLFEAARRTIGLGMCLLVAVFVAYQLFGYVLPPPLGHGQSGIDIFVDQQFLMLEGIFGIPVGVSVEVVFYFIFFAAVFEVFGGGKMIMDLTLAMTGRYRGGPAKAAVVSSGLNGLISGSAVANVMSGGIFTIPLMIRTGYSPRFAGAIEAVASTGGQLMPPVMGAAAFVMADLLRIPYHELIIAAALPACFYFLAIFLTVDFQARKDDITTTPPDQIPPWLAVLRTHGHLILPLIWLGYRVVSGYSVATSCIEAIVVTIVVGTLFPSTRATPHSLAMGFADSAFRTITVAIPCALAGIIIGTIAYTGLGTKFTSFIVDVSAGSLALAIILTIMGALLLGFGMPTTSAYIMAAVLLAPALIEIGITPLAAHMLVLYFACLSMITPPIALAAFAAAGIAGTSATATGFTAFRLAIPLMTIPVVFLWREGLFLAGGAAEIASAVLLTTISVTALSATVIGWFLRPLGWIERGLFLLIAIGCVLPKDVIFGLLLSAASAIGIALWWLASGRLRRDVGPQAG